MEANLVVAASYSVNKRLLSKHGIILYLELDPSRVSNGAAGSLSDSGWFERYSSWRESVAPRTSPATETADLSPIHRQPPAALDNGYETRMLYAKR